MQAPRGRQLLLLLLTDPDLVEARMTIAALQTALDAANARVREAEARVGQLNLRLAAANERADELEHALWRLQAMQADDCQPFVERSPQHVDDCALRRDVNTLHGVDIPAQLPPACK